MLSDESKSKLSPAQIATAERWNKEDIDIQEIVAKIDAALENNDEEAFTVAVDELADSIQMTCEHGRSIFARCGECDVIESIVYPYVD